MKQAVIEIRPDSAAVMKEFSTDLVKAWETGAPSHPLATFTFSSSTQLFSVFTPKRWELIERLQKIGPSSVRGLARALGRDVRRVHDDTMVMVEWGIVERNEAGKVFVPFDVIHIDFDLRAAA